MFQDCLQVSRPTFAYLCHLLGPILSKIDTKFGPYILIDVKISISLHQLGSSDNLHTLADLMIYQGHVLQSLLEILVKELNKCWGFKEQP